MISDREESEGGGGVARDGSLRSGLAYLSLLLVLGSQPVTARADSTRESFVDDRHPAEFPTARVRPGYWLKSGWGRLKWGMGPADVVDVVGRDAVTTWTPDKVGSRNRQHMQIRLPPKDALAAKYADLWFGDAGLEAVEVSPGLVRYPGDTPTREEAAANFEASRKKLVALHGKDRCEDLARDGYDYRVCRWEVGKETQVSLRDGDYIGDRYRLARVLYENRERAQRLDESSLLQSDLSRTVNPRTWSAYGLGPLRFGMGLGDVYERMGRVDPERGPICQPSCSGDRKGYVRCSTGGRVCGLALGPTFGASALVFSGWELSAIEVERRDLSPAMLADAQAEALAFLREVFGPVRRDGRMMEATIAGEVSAWISAENGKVFGIIQDARQRKAPPVKPPPAPKAPAARPPPSQDMKDL